jgi:hypothetical protein
MPAIKRWPRPWTSLSFTSTSDEPAYPVLSLDIDRTGRLLRQRVQIAFIKYLLFF